MSAKHRRPNRLRRSLYAAAPVAVALGIVANPAAAGAQPVLSNTDATDALERAGIQVPQDVQDTLDRFLPNGAPEAPAPAPEPVIEEEAPAEAAVDDAVATLPESPCPVTAKVCVDVDGERTWLQDENGLRHGPVAMKPGKPGEETPRGDFNVTRKVKDEVSYLYDMAPMPYAVYFTNNGHAFHEGSLEGESAGCVRLQQQDAITFFDYLQVGDQVFIY